VSNNGGILPKKDLTLIHRLQNKEQPKNRTQIANKPKKTEINPNKTSEHNRKQERFFLLGIR
jgi:hypothetical protein